MRLSSTHYLSVPVLLFLYAIITLTLPTPTPTISSLYSFATPSSLSFASASSPPSPPPPGPVWVQLVHRHGDRTPIHPFPNTTGWTDYNLPPGSLTSIGWAQHSAVGRWLRHRYAIESQLINPQRYRPRSLTVRSTQVERCVQSVEALLTGLYEPHLQNQSAMDVEEVQHHKKTTPPFPPLEILPIPLETLLQATDKCPAYALLYPDTRRALDAYIDREYPGMLSKLLPLTNYGTFPIAKSVASVVSWTADNLLCEEAHDIVSSAELTAMYYPLTNLSRLISYNTFVGDAREPRGQIGDLLLRDITRSVLGKIRVLTVGETVGGDGDVWADTMADEKMRIYSAHDTTVVSLLASMHLLHNTSFWLLPPYATVMTMEMRMTDSGTYTLGWRIGYPRLAQGMVWDKWEMHDETLDMPCPDDTVVDRGATVALAPTCPVGAFLRYVLIMTDPMYDSRGAEYRAALPTAESTATELLAFLPLFPPTPLYTYPANDGCCVPPADLLTRCPTWQAYEDASGACQLMRRLCPDVACGAGLTVAVGSFGCVRAEQMSVADSVKDAVIVVCSLVIALLFGVVGVQWRRGSTVSRKGYDEVGVSGRLPSVGNEGTERPPSPTAADKVRSQVEKGRAKMRAIVDVARSGLQGGEGKGGKRRREMGETEETEKLEMTDLAGEDGDDDELSFTSAALELDGEDEEQL